MMLNSFHSDYQFALAAFLIVANDNSFLRLYPLEEEGDFDRNDVDWTCDEYDYPLGPPKGKGISTSDMIYERSFEYADVWLDVANTDYVITWYEAPVAHWLVNEGSGTVVADSSGNGYDGILSGGTWTEGKDRGAIEFNGNSSSDWVSIPAPLFDNISNEITVALWVRGDADHQPQADSLFYVEDESGNRLFNIHLPWSDSKVYWDAGNDSGYDRISQTISEDYFADEWHHWTFTKNSDTGEMSIYLDGTLWHSTTDNTIAMSTTAATAILGSGNGDNYYEGVLDDVRIYNTVPIHPIPTI